MYVASILSFFVFGLSVQPLSIFSTTWEERDASYSGVAAYRMKSHDKQNDSHVDLGRKSHGRQIGSRVDSGLKSHGKQNNSHADLGGRSIEHDGSLLDLNAYRASSNESATYELKLSRTLMSNRHWFLIVAAAALLILILAKCCFRIRNRSARTARLGPPGRLGQEESRHSVSDAAARAALISFFADEAGRAHRAKAGARGIPESTSRASNAENVNTSSSRPLSNDGGSGDSGAGASANIDSSHSDRERAVKHTAKS
eukprot:TRINITY_DN43283_c0_g1_i1.p1 TRINITY_DN43283_c0_g1~~TRINITY_DN43283_c0_g1_i1.p1  ORF type:complete len:257 (-),score=27.60 TRINITY_DN43283_c0_g1_i1:474-1244(-)